MSVKRTDIAEKLRLKRKELRISQQEMADKLGIKRCTYARYETTVIPSANIIIKISDILNMSTDELLNHEGEYQSKVHQPISSGEAVSTRSIYNENEIYDFNNEQFTDEEIELIYKLRGIPSDRRDAIKRLIISDPG